MSTATDMRDAYLVAEKALLEGKTISFQGRTLGMEDLDSIRAGRQEWEARVASEVRAASGTARPTLGGCRVSFARFGD